MAKKKKVKKEDIIVRKYNKTRVLAQWHTKAFGFSPSTITTFGNLSINNGYTTEEKGKLNGMNKLKKKSEQNGTVSMTVPLRKYFLENPREEYEWWKKQCAAFKKSMLYIGKKAVSNNMWFIESLNVSNVKVSSNGEWTSADMTLTFKESPKKWGPGEKKKLITDKGFGKNTRTTVDKQVWNYKKQKYEDKTIIEFTDE